MELKLNKVGLLRAEAEKLLIVPYGIETLLLSCLNSLNCLLIVPYGIETSSRNPEYHFF